MFRFSSSFIVIHSFVPFFGILSYHIHTCLISKTKQRSEGKRKKEKEEASVNRMTGIRKRIVSLIMIDIYLLYRWLSFLCESATPGSRVYRNTIVLSLSFCFIFVRLFRRQRGKLMINACGSEWVLLFDVHRCICICTDVVFSLLFFVRMMLIIVYFMTFYLSFYF